MSHVAPIVASAPGKMMVAGEYAVLESEAAIVTAVSRRVTVTLGAKENSFLGPEVLATRERLVNVETRDLPLFVDVSDLKRGDLKLGLGSSSAAAAATAAAFLDAREKDERLALDELFEHALVGHRAIAPAGSGADVAAAVFGGFVRFAPNAPGSTLPIVTPLPGLPAGLIVRVVFSGASARTSDLVALVRDLKVRRPEVYRARIADIAQAARGMVDVWTEAAPSHAILEFTAAHHEAMAALGKDAGAEIVNDALANIARLAADVGAASKPSGAGGGDIAIAFFINPESAERFDALIRETPYTRVDLGLGEPGVRMDSRGTPR